MYGGAVAAPPCRAAARVRAVPAACVPGGGAGGVREQRGKAARQGATKRHLRVSWTRRWTDTEDDATGGGRAPFVHCHLNTRRDAGWRQGELANVRAAAQDTTKNAWKCPSKCRTDYHALDLGKVLGSCTSPFTSAPRAPPRAASLLSFTPPGRAGIPGFWRSTAGGKCFMMAN